MVREPPVVAQEPVANPVGRIGTSVFHLQVPTMKKLAGKRLVTDAYVKPTIIYRLLVIDTEFF